MKILKFFLIMFGLLWALNSFASYPANLTFNDNGDDTISEIGGTSLMWANEDGGVDLEYGQAKVYCENLNLGGYSDWRSPVVSELLTIINYNLSNPAFYPIFSKLTIYNYWTSSLNSGVEGEAWVVNMQYGLLISQDVGTINGVYCVRSQPVVYAIIATSSMPQVYSGFTYGEIVSSFFIFLIFLGVFTILFIKLIFKKDL
jgi:hypothetical protein